MKKEIKVTYFKSSGKYYVTETTCIPDGTMQVFQIVDWLRENCQGYKGMNLVAMLDELDHGYPIMLPASDRD